jgi:hypothetical protein
MADTSTSLIQSMVERMTDHYELVAAEFDDDLNAYTRLYGADGNLEAARIALDDFMHRLECFNHGIPFAHTLRKAG